LGVTPLAMLACVRRSLRRPITQQVEQLLEAVMALEAALQENAPPHITGELRFPGTGAAIPHIALLCARHMRLKSRGADTRVAEIVVVRVPKWSACDHDVCHHSAESDFICASCSARVVADWTHNAVKKRFPFHDAAERELESAAALRLDRGYAVVNDDRYVAVPPQLASSL
jgi:hypothetical protein